MMILQCLDHGEMGSWGLGEVLTLVKKIISAQKKIREVLLYEYEYHIENINS